MLSLLLVVLAAAVARIVSASEAHAPFVGEAWGAALVSGGLVALVLVHWVLYPGAARDLVGGGFARLDESGTGFRWLNWGILYTRAGEIDVPAKRVRVWRRLFLGLLPVGAIDRSFDEFYRVAIDAESPHDSTTSQSYGSSQSGIDLGDIVGSVLTGTDITYDTWSDRRGSIPIRWSYRVALVDRHARELNLLVFSETFTHRGDAIVGRLREKLTELVALDRRRIGVNLPHDPRPAGEDPGPAPPKKGPHTVCPNCKREFPVSQKTCTACHVAVFRDD
ncbi:hypothetical protein HY251_00315 [bacterium]|nr:hypothetical protein [bacterium]